MEMEGFTFFTRFAPNGQLTQVNNNIFNLGDGQNISVTELDSNGMLIPGNPTANPPVSPESVTVTRHLSYGDYAETATFLGVTNIGLAFEYSDGARLILHNSVSTYNGQSSFSDVTLHQVSYNFDGVFCFLEGTGIATPGGDVPVETLKIGDAITTADGRTVAVKWVGIQRTARSVMTELKAAPVVITKGALGDGLPHTDLYVTCDHGMLIDGLVINAGALVNHTTIRHVPMAEMPAIFTYYHVETGDHDAILANGAAAETFIDYVDRRNFDNYQEYLDLYGAERIIQEMPYPRVSAQRLVPEAIKARLGGGPDWDARLEDPDMTITLSRGAA